MTAAPYAADTRAKGWRFELDLERVRQSDTWALASPDVRPWLLMLWCTAWEQTPCGSLPADDELIAARIGMSVRLFAKHRAILLRGWWEADDGRMYQPTITARVLEMLDYRAKQAKRVADHKARMRDQRAANALPTPQHDDSNDTGTGTGTRTGTIKTENGEERARTPKDDGEFIPDTTGWTPTPGGLASRAIRAAGIADVNPSHPDLQRLLAAGVTAQELADAAAVCVSKGKASFAYLLSTVEGQRRDAAAKAAVPVEVAKPITVASSEADKTAELLRTQAERGATKPPAHLLALAGRAVKTA